MTSRVLVPMDDSELSEQALRYALETHDDAEITVMHVVGGPSSMLGEATALALEEDIEAAAEEHASEVLDWARDIATEYDRDIEAVIEMGRPAHAIVDRAEAFDTVVIGSHGSSLAERLFVGNVAQTVFRRCPVPVTIVR